MLAYLHLFTSRETATLLWGVMVLAYVAVKSDQLWPSLLRTVRAMFALKLIVVWVTTAAYAMGLVTMAASLGFWDTNASKETAYWFVGTAAVLAEMR